MNTRQMGEVLAESVGNVIKSCIVTYGSPSKSDAIYLATCAADAALRIIADLTAPETTSVSTEPHTAPISRNLN